MNSRLRQMEFEKTRGKETARSMEGVRLSERRSRGQEEGNDHILVRGVVARSISSGNICSRSCNVPFTSLFEIVNPCKTVSHTRSSRTINRKRFSP